LWGQGFGPAAELLLGLVDDKSTPNRLKLPDNLRLDDAARKGSGRAEAHKR
jgi:hypothetical protein